MRDALVSVGMSVYNSSETVETAVQSIIKQSYTNWELIIIDDGSTDNTLNVLEKFTDKRIKVHSDGLNKGLAVRLNELVHLSSGEYFARMDADDISYPDRIEKQLIFLCEHDYVDLVSTRVLIVSDDLRCMGTYPYHVDHDEICSRPYSGFYMPHPTWMGKKKWFLDNLYNEKSFMSEDQELLLRTYASSTFHCIDEILLGYRVPRITLKKEYKTRLSRVMDYARIFKRKKQYFLIFKVFVIQSVKLLYSVIAIMSPYTYMLLKNRALPVDQGECDRWCSIKQIICSNDGASR